MYGEPIQALNNALSGMIHSLRTDAQAQETLWICIVTFDREVKEIINLTDLQSFQLPEITCPQSGPTNTGKGLELIYEKVTNDIRKGSSEQKGDWRPLLFVFTDGKPSDIQLYRSTIPKIKQLNFGTIIGCAAGKLADNAILKELCDTVVHIDTADSGTLRQFFKWVSDAIELGNKSMGATNQVSLPPAPTEEFIVL
jgi:uncharacterized protein YegL